MSDVRRSLGDSSDEFSEGGSQTTSGSGGSNRQSVICYTERGQLYPAKLSLSSEESEEDSSVSDRNSQTTTPSRHQSSEFENEEFSLRGRSSSTNEEDPEALLLTELESHPIIASRYTEKDSEFAQELAARDVPSPVITQWAGSSRQWQRGRGGRGRGNQFEDRKRHFESDDDRGERGAKSFRGGGGGYHNNRDNRHDQQQRQGNSHSSYTPSSSYSCDRQSGNHNHR